MRILQKVCSKNLDVGRPTVTQPYISAHCVITNNNYGNNQIFGVQQEEMSETCVWLVPIP